MKMIEIATAFADGVRFGIRQTFACGANGRIVSTAIQPRIPARSGH